MGSLDSRFPWMSFHLDSFGGGWPVHYLIWFWLPMVHLNLYPSCTIVKMEILSFRSKRILYYFILSPVMTKPLFSEEWCWPKKGSCLYLAAVWRMISVSDGSGLSWFNSAQIDRPLTVGSKKSWGHLWVVFCACWLSTAFGWYLYDVLLLMDMGVKDWEIFNFWWQKKQEDIKELILLFLMDYLILYDLHLM